MAVQDKITLKSFFETGDLPTESNFEDLIDSSLGLDQYESDTIKQTPKDPINFPVVAGNTHYWLNVEALALSEEGKAAKLYVAFGAAINFDVVFVSIIEGVATILKSTNLTAPSSGVNVYDLDSSGVAFSPNVYVAIRPGTTQLLYRNDAVAGNSRHFTGTGLAVSTAGYEFCYWLGYDIRHGAKSTDATKTVTGQHEISTFDIYAEVLNNRYVVLPAGDIILSTPLAIPSNTTIIGVRGRTRLVMNFIGVGIAINGTSNITLSGFEIVGTGPTIDITDATLSTDAEIDSLAGFNAQYGLFVHLGTVQNLRFDNIVIKNIDGVGLEMRADHNLYLGSGFFSGIQVQNCYLGVRIRTASEYNNYNGIRCHQCFIGMAIYGGNNYVTGSNFSYCRIGVIIGAGSNNSHGTISATAINHCALYGIYSTGILHGFCFVGCQTWDSVFRIIDANGFSFSSGIVGGAVQLKDNTFVMFSDNLHPITYNAFTITEEGTNTIQLTNNFSIFGVPK